MIGKLKIKKMYPLLLVVVIARIIAFLCSYYTGAKGEFFHSVELVKSDFVAKLILAIIVIVISIVSIGIVYLFSELLLFISKEILQIEIQFEKIFIAYAIFMIVTAIQPIFRNWSLFSLSFLNPISVLGTLIFGVLLYHFSKNKVLAVSLSICVCFSIHIINILQL
ncbi:hypothetical protein SAMN02745116_00597 [Pilibacter termitis]|uniref:Uncharacterized protein n=1 Tax=Pilibacter termitis TaxID=263852 RepID=A0A1T4LBJ4_9ENTE|nr:hypothetical protein [Pilibacter termitis]SJZ51877.1 hypothetical protein SAMN02745116_00597 [Pilibacter termitis]